METFADIAKFADFVNLAEAIGKTTKRLEKARLLAAYWATVDDAALHLSARYISGCIFASWDQRVLSVGYTTIVKVLGELSGIESAVLKQRLVQLGDLGELAEEVLPPPQRPTPWSLDALEKAFAECVLHTKPAQRVAALRDILATCSPLEAKYLTKLVLGDLRIGLKEGNVEDAIARAFDVDVAAVQWTNMLLGDPGETAVRARHGDFASVQMRLFHPLKFMLASPAADLEAVRRQLPGEFALEDKYDGIRAQAHISAGGTSPAAHGIVHNGVRVALFSRTLDEITESFPELVAPLASLVRGEQRLVLDGEILAVHEGTVLPFAALQKRLGRKAPSADVLRDTPIAMMLFDVLVRDAQVLLQEPFAARRAILQSLPAAPHVTVAPSQIMQGTGGINDAFTAARLRGNEGLMLKALDSIYKPGRRGRDWLKVKRPKANLDVVITAAEVGHGKRHHVLSDYTFAVRRSDEDPTLLDIGKAYSGLTDKEIAELTVLLRSNTLEIVNHGKKHLVRPVVVLEVTFDLVQPSKRYTSGYALRFPRIVRWRTDKPASEIDTLATLASHHETAP